MTDLLGKPKFPRERYQLGKDYRFRCTNCGKFKEAGFFQKQTRSRWGINPQCRLCINAKTVATKDRAAAAKRSRERETRIKKRDKLADKQYEKWLWRQEQGLSVTLGKPGWSKVSDCCIGCGTFYHVHQAKGMCALCYRRDYYGNKKVHSFNRKGKWSHMHDACITCGGTEARHVGAGVCSTCRSKSARLTAPQKLCEQCNNPIPRTTYYLKKKFCNNACSTKAYRARRMERDPGWGERRKQKAS